MVKGPEGEGGGLDPPTPTPSLTWICGYTPYEGLKLANQKDRKYLTRSWRETAYYFMDILINISQNKTRMFK